MSSLTSTSHSSHPGGLPDEISRLIDSWRDASISAADQQRLIDWFAEHQTQVPDELKAEAAIFKAMRFDGIPLSDHEASLMVDQAISPSRHRIVRRACAIATSGLAAAAAITVLVIATSTANEPQPVASLQAQTADAPQIAQVEQQSETPASQCKAAAQQLNASVAKVSKAKKQRHLKAVATSPIENDAESEDELTPEQAATVLNDVCSLLASNLDQAAYSAQAASEQLVQARATMAKVLSAQQ